ncbi:tyrosine-type recombinase/integrase [Sphaerimonospora thailandensis]|uniref:Tyr recombinase domain-containing protein n=1 Tax=Sphaerimonospora thailandensis TaxID=795644 RepID=A0A8J3R8V0_9ACTN|nr:site-specific integrase [Sphaerimonospora thailandensis]GIH69492.1 hypothetical protein Mth01_17450 [Sphaerimonospora thailandensis]
MPSYRKLPSGLWQASVRLPSGRRVTKTDKLKKVVQSWASEQEALIARGHRVDPRAGRITVAEWHAKWWEARVVEDETRRGDETTWRLHVEPHWREWRLGDVGRIDVQKWVRTLQKDGVGPHAIRHAYNLLVSLMGDAAMEGLIPVSPCQKIDLPATPPKAPAWFTREQVDLIQAELPPGHAVMTELMCYAGLRWGEAAAVAGADRDDEVGNPVDWLRGKIRIRGAMSQGGKWKPYPKNSASRGEVPVPRHVLDMMAPLLAGRARDGWVFVATRRAPGSDRGTAERPTLSGSNWTNRFVAAIKAANKKIEAANRGLPADRQRAPIPAYSTHDCRHTAASWLVQAGVPLYDVQHLLRHASYQTTMRYAHLAPDAHNAVESGWSKIIAHQGRTAPDRRSGEGG